MIRQQPFSTHSTLTSVVAFPWVEIKVINSYLHSKQDELRLLMGAVAALTAATSDNPRTYAEGGRVLGGRFPAPWRQDSRRKRWP